MTYWNRLLLDRDREHYKETIDEMFRVLPAGMAGKPARANVQQAFMVDTVRHFAEPTDEILCVGSFTDTAFGVLNQTGYNIYGIDPHPSVNGIYLHDHWLAHQKEYDLVFSTSVIEHVPDDDEFFDEVCKSIKPGGYGILTMDFKEGWKLGQIAVGTVYRFYTLDDLNTRFSKLLKVNNCELVGESDWTGEPDFQWENQMYCFATYVFRKGKNNDSL
jgi:SAM-dependent methyltransferase